MTRGLSVTKSVTLPTTGHPELVEGLGVHIPNLFIATALLSFYFALFLKIFYASKFSTDG
jgi:hypothetical protein